MLRRAAAARLEDIAEADDVRLDADVRMVDGIPDARPRRAVDDNGGPVLREGFVDRRIVRDGAFDEDVLRAGGLRGLFDQAEPDSFGCGSQ